LRFGYIRVSTVEQNTDRQYEEMKDCNLDELFIEKMSGKDRSRPVLQKMMDRLREGDSVTVLSIDRLARNTKDLLELVEEMESKKVRFISLRESIDTTTEMGKFLLTVMGAVAELERGQIRERQMQGIALAKRYGRYKGRKKTEIPDFDRIYTQYREGKITSTQGAQLLKISRSTFYRRGKNFSYLKPGVEDEIIEI
jgi:DNA invertase Pin-like site-specific DNA recombinase